MNKIVLFVFISMAVIAVSGCTGEVGVSQEREVEDKTETEIKTDEGTVKITGTAGESSDWCHEGGDWEMTTTGMEGDMSATWKIDKLETSGKYEGLCHVIYTVTSPEGDTRMDYWFDESGENGYVEIEMGGQKITQEWHG